MLFSEDAPKTTDWIFNELIYLCDNFDIFSSNFTLDNFKTIIKSKSTILAALLLKQEIFCGIGNYIKNEALHLTNLNIKVKTNELTDIQITKLYNYILFKLIYKFGIRRWLDTFKPSWVKKSFILNY